MKDREEGERERDRWVIPIIPLNPFNNAIYYLKHVVLNDESNLLIRFFVENFMIPQLFCRDPMSSSHNDEKQVF